MNEPGKKKMKYEQLQQIMNTPEKWIENKTNQMEQMFLQKTRRKDREFFISSLLKDWENRGK